MKEIYKEVNHDEKKTIIIAKATTYEEMYRRLDTKEREHGIHQLAKLLERRQGDLWNVRYIKDDNYQVLVNGEDI